MNKMCDLQIKKLWIIFMLLGTLQRTQAAWLRCYKDSLTEYMVTPLEYPLPIAHSSCLDRSQPTVIYTFGYQGKVAGPATTAVLTAYIAKRKRNVILLDWEEEAKSGLLGLQLGYATSAAPNAKKIGYALGRALHTLSGAGVDLNTIHLMGHSLGAHVMGYAGRWLRERGKIVSRITGLDPARALFEGTFGFFKQLDRTCALFVDIIHTDAGNYGTSKSTGTVDIWPNYYGPKSQQPGCPRKPQETFSRADLCDHDRSWQYFIEAMLSGTNISAVYADNYRDWMHDYSRSNITIYMGDLINTRARGNFFCSTNAQPPFGKGSEGLKPDYVIIS
ncbi:PREDICTED: lipase member H-B-like [Papilio polytes]|uniref:lipase member H-B-like n=1 Tax=Papilio polytes TaxID=76194 RepID=UPI00067639ED|nr:PREDICTED: lipase member H-B-like [Papilio polytes]